MRSPRAPQPVRDRERPVLDAAWDDPPVAPSLVDAILIMRVASQNAERLQAFDNKVRK